MAVVQFNSDTSDPCFHERATVLLQLQDEWKRRDILLTKANDEIQRLTDQLMQTQESSARLTGEVAHDLNNLLTVIAGHTDLLLLTLRPNDPNCDSVDAITEAIARATVLTRRLIAFKQSIAAQK
jgi:two-component system cell cycle sensor histidine kinase/response regulator CckA